MAFQRKMLSCDLQADGDSSFEMSTDRLKGIPKEFFRHKVKEEKVIMKSAIFHHFFFKSCNNLHVSVPFSSKSGICFGKRQRYLHIAEGKYLFMTSRAKGKTRNVTNLQS